MEKLKEPLFFINMKAYEEGIGKNAIEIAKIAKDVSEELGIEIIIVPHATDISSVAKITKTFAQHIDPFTPGAHTGSIIAEAVKESGAIGTVLNHAERKLDNKTLERSIQRAHENELVVMCCAESLERIEEIVSFEEKPEYIAFEPPELIGGNISVSKAKPDAIKNACEIVDKYGIKLIVGAGIKDYEDAKASIMLGAKGIFVASGIVKAQDRKAAITKLAKGLKRWEDG